jgi:two-component system, chemotaxis family, chemotaxis protein CheY
MSNFGECDITVDGSEAIEAFIMAAEEKNPYDLICLDIMMPKVDGLKVLQSIRNFEKESNVEKKAKIILTTALNDSNFVHGAFDNGCDAYAAKPLNTSKLREVLKKLSLIE